MPTSQGARHACLTRWLGAHCTGGWRPATLRVWTQHRSSYTALAAGGVITSLQAAGLLPFRPSADKAAVLARWTGGPGNCWGRRSWATKGQPGLVTGSYRISGVKQRSFSSATAAAAGFPARGAESSSGTAPVSGRRLPQSRNRAFTQGRQGRDRRPDQDGQAPGADGSQGANNSPTRGRYEGSVSVAGGSDSRATNYRSRQPSIATASRGGNSRYDSRDPLRGNSNSQTRSGAGLGHSTVASSRRARDGLERSDRGNPGSRDPRSSSRSWVSHASGGTAAPAAPDRGDKEEPRPESYSQRVARLRKPALTAADKLGLEPEERARIFRQLRTPRRRSALPAGFAAADGSNRTRDAAPDGAGRGSGSGLGQRSLLQLPLRVYCYGIDDVRLYRALEEADALGLVVVVPDVASADAVWATRTKRTGKALTLTEVFNAARNAGKRFVELTAVSSVRVMEAVEALTGWPVPERLRHRAPPPLVFLPPLEEDPSGSAEALKVLSGGLPLPNYLIARAGRDLPPLLLRELDRTDLYDSRDELRPANPQEQEAQRQQSVFRPYMARSRVARQRLLQEQMRRRVEVEGGVSW